VNLLDGKASVVILGGVQVDYTYKKSLELLQKHLDNVGKRINSFSEIHPGDYICVIPPRNTIATNKYVPLSVYLVREVGNRFTDDGKLSYSSSEPDTPGIFISTSEHKPFGYVLEVGSKINKRILPDFALIEIQPAEIQDGLIYQINKAFIENT